MGVLCGIIMAGDEEKGSDRGGRGGRGGRGRGRGGKGGRGGRGGGRGGKGRGGFTGKKTQRDQRGGSPSTKRSKPEERSTPHNADGPKKARKKMKVALLISYCGTKYQGMQINPDADSIEKHLFAALIKANAVSELNSTALQKIKWMRCARTDKGVSALRQIVSCKLELDTKTPRNLIEATNEHLPSDIRLIDFVNVTGSFHSKNNCEARTYKYLLNVEALRPSEKHPDFANRDQWTFNDEEQQKLERLLKRFLGTHRFHNFTPKMNFETPSCQRYIMEIGCSPVINVDDVCFTCITIKGQSFMLHQIRNMIGTVLFVFRDGAPPQVVDKTMKNIQVHLPMAPGHGLMLERCHFDGYNKFKAPKAGRETLEFELCEDQIQAFEKDVVYPSIKEQEKEGNLTMTWISEQQPLDYQAILDAISLAGPRKRREQSEKQESETKDESTSTDKPETQTTAPEKSENEPTPSTDSQMTDASNSNEEEPKTEPTPGAVEESTIAEESKEQTSNPTDESNADTKPSSS